MVIGEKYLNSKIRSWSVNLHLFFFIYKYTHVHIFLLVFVLVKQVCELDLDEMCVWYAGSV